MSLRGLLKPILPPPRQRVTLRSALPLIAFLAVFGSACLCLELFGVVLFSSPWAFALLGLAPWLWWMHLAGYSGLRGARAVVALLLRLLVLAAFVAVLAEPRAVRLSHALAVVYALDLSDSVDPAEVNKALTYVAATTEAKPESDEAGLIAFARDAVVELPPGISFPFEKINSRIVRDGTNLEKALSLAAAMLPEERHGRIVLVSDGASNEGDLARVLGELKARSIPVDVVPVEYHHEHEVWLEKLDLPRLAKVGQPYKATLIIASRHQGTGTLVLEENGQPLHVAPRTADPTRKTVEFTTGKTPVTVTIPPRQAGFYEYVARIEVPDGKDGWDKNNIARNHVYLEGPGRVLVVTRDRTREEEQKEEAEPVEDWRHLVEALKSGKRNIDLRTATQFPRDAFALLPYDCIIVPNVPANAFDGVQLRALHDAVYHQGSGFLMVGGRHSFGPGGYQRTAVERLLPVTMDISQKKVLPKGALVICLHTCEFDAGNTWGKRIAKQAIKVLSKQDDVGVLVYEYAEKWLFKLTPAGRYNELIPLINEAVIGDMPSFGTTMQMALDALKASDAAAKHMIIISDGDPSPPLPGLLAQFAQGGISISTVAICPHPGDDLAIATMTDIANRTGGRYYLVQKGEVTRLPGIFIREAKTLRRNLIQKKTFAPRLEVPSPILQGNYPAPKLHGFVLTTPKSQAVTILRGPSEEDVDPVLATWRYGVGKTAAFTSDLAANWGADWLRWERYAAFVNQLITDIARGQMASELILQCSIEGRTATLIVDDTHKELTFLEVKAQVAGPDERSVTVPLKQVGPRRYHGQLPIWGKGNYHVVARGLGGGRDERALGRFSVAYSPEYLRFGSDPIVLRRIAERTGGRLLAGRADEDEIFVRPDEPKASSRPLFDLLLIVLACLIPLDVGIRRVQIDWHLVRSWLRFGRGKRATEKTLGALLSRKKAIEFPAAEKRPEQPLGPPEPAEPLLLPPEALPPTEPAPEEPEPTSTTERLLAMKKKWKRK